jgi:hypothetical protein
VQPGYADTQYHLVAGAFVGASDNPHAQPIGSPAQTDGFATARGEVELGHIGRLSAERLAYAVMATSWLRDTQSSITQTLSLSSNIQASPLARVTLRASAMLTQFSMVDTATANDPSTVGPLPSGEQKFLGINAGEDFSWQFGKLWSLAQALEGHLYDPITNQQSAAGSRGATLGAGLSHLWIRDSATLQSRAGTTVSSGGAMPGRVAALGDLLLNWRHEWTAEIAHELGAGVSAIRVDQTRTLPVGFASLSWRRATDQIELRAERSATSSVYVATVYEQSFVRLGIGIPIDRSQALRLLAAADLEHDSAQVSSAGLSGTANVLFARFGLRWQPGGTFAYGLEYTFRDQRADAADSASSTFASFRRQMVTLTIEGQYPSRFM